VPVTVNGQGYPMPLDQLVYEQEVARSVFLLAEQGGWYSAGGVIYGQQQGELDPPSPSQRWWLPSTCSSIPSWGMRRRRTRCC